MSECTHPSTQACRYIQKNGSPIVVSQCLTCGNNLRALPKADFVMDVLPDWDANLQVEYQSERSNEWQRCRDTQAEKFRQEQEAKTGAWWESYNTYLNSEHWRRLRLIVLNRDILCQACLKLRSNEVHHLSYDSFRKWGVSFSVECVGLCSGCHGRIHEKDNHGLA